MSEMYNDLSVTEHFFFNRNLSTEGGYLFLHRLKKKCKFAIVPIKQKLT